MNRQQLEVWFIDDGVPTSMPIAWRETLELTTSAIDFGFSTLTRTPPMSRRPDYSLYGRPPASIWAVEGLPRVAMEKKEGGTCVICMEEGWGDNGLAAELPCKHKYHFECVKKWLEIHATCPQCRYEMPLEGEEEEELMKKFEVNNDEFGGDDDSDDDEDDSDDDE